MQQEREEIDSDGLSLNKTASKQENRDRLHRILAEARGSSDDQSTDIEDHRNDRMNHDNIATQDRSARPGKKKRQNARQDLAKRMGVIPYSKKAVTRWRKKIRRMCMKRGVMLDQCYSEYDVYDVIVPLVRSVHKELVADYNIQWDRKTLNEIIKVICQDDKRNLQAERREELALQSGLVSNRQRKHPAERVTQEERPPPRRIRREIDFESEDDDDQYPNPRRPSKERMTPAFDSGNDEHYPNSVKSSMNPVHTSKSNDVSRRVPHNPSQYSSQKSPIRASKGTIDDRRGQYETHRPNRSSVGSVNQYNTPMPASTTRRQSNYYDIPKPKTSRQDTSISSVSPGMIYNKKGLPPTSRSKYIGQDHDLEAEEVHEIIREPHRFKKSYAASMPSPSKSSVYENSPIRVGGAAPDSHLLLPGGILLTDTTNIEGTTRVLVPSAQFQVRVSNNMTWNKFFYYITTSVLKCQRKDKLAYMPLYTVATVSWEVLWGEQEYVAMIEEYSNVGVRLKSMPKSHWIKILEGDDEGSEYSSVNSIPVSTASKVASSLHSYQSPKTPVPVAFGTELPAPPKAQPAIQLVSPVPPVFQLQPPAPPASQPAPLAPFAIQLGDSVPSTPLATQVSPLFLPPSPPKKGALALPFPPPPPVPAVRKRKYQNVMTEKRVTRSRAGKGPNLSAAALEIERNNEVASQEQQLMMAKKVVRNKNAKRN